MPNPSTVELFEPELHTPQLRLIAEAKRTGKRLVLAKNEQDFQWHWSRHFEIAAMGNGKDIIKRHVKRELWIVDLGNGKNGFVTHGPHATEAACRKCMAGTCDCVAKKKEQAQLRRILTTEAQHEVV